MGSSFIATCVDRNALYVTRLTPAVQLIERVEASFQIGEQRESRAALFSRILRRDRAQQLRDRRAARIAVLRAQVIEDLRLEILQPHGSGAHAAGATRA